MQAAARSTAPYPSKASLYINRVHGDSLGRHTHVRERILTALLVVVSVASTPGAALAAHRPSDSAGLDARAISDAASSGGRGPNHHAGPIQIINRRDVSLVFDGM